MKYSLFSGSHGFPTLGFSHRENLGSELPCSAKHILMWPDVAPQMTKNLAMGVCLGLFLNCEAQKVLLCLRSFWVNFASLSDH